MPAPLVLTILQSAGAVLGNIGGCLAAPIRRQFTYMCCFNSNITKLETQLKKLETTRQGVQLGVDDTRRKVRVVGPTVEAWLTYADEVKRDVEGIIEDKAKVNEGCLNGWFPNLKLRYSLSRKAVNKTTVLKDLQVVGELHTKSSYSPPPASTDTIPNRDFTEFESRRLVMEEIINALKPDEINKALKPDEINNEINEIGMVKNNLIGICGLPGVGKTKMVQEVGKRAKEEKHFDEIPYVVVGQKPDLPKIQKCIGENLGIDSIGKFDDASTRAGLLRERLVQDDKKILLILDDVWEEFDLQDLGIPLGGYNKNFKMLYTSRRQRLWHDVQTKKEISLEPLSEDEAWQLFKEKAGNLVDNPNLHPTAKQIVGKCGRLPLALVIIGRTLSKKSGGNFTKDIWEEMLDRLTFPSGTLADERLLLSLETNYNYVEDEEAKRLFLLCCLFEEDKYISIEDLARYGLGLSLFHGIHEMRKVRHRVVALVDDLMSRYLLLGPDIDGQVKLHDVVRDMGISIASRYKGSLVSHGNVSEWPKEGTYEDYTSISLISQKTIKFREGLRCPNLQFLLLRCKNLDEMPCNFFDGIKILRVLVLIGYLGGPTGRLDCSLAVQSLRSLRTLCLENLNAALDHVSAIGDLEDLEILSLGGCSVVELPTEIGKLAKLKLLDLTDCKLERIAPKVISRLVGLEELYMIDCGYVGWEGEGNVKGINADLREFEFLSKLNTLEVRINDASLVPQIPIFSKLKNFLIEIEDPFRSVDWGFRRPKPNYLSISSVTPIRSNYGGLNSLLRRTECLALQGNGTGDLVMELFVEGPEGLQLLKDLIIGQCATQECLVNTMNPPAQLNATASVIFRYLETLHLYMLPKLREICHGPVLASSFGELTSLNIERCFLMEEVIRIDQGEAGDVAIKTIEFPKLERLVLQELPRLVGFCRGVDKIYFPELRELSVTSVGSFSLFSQEVSLPNLEKLELVGLDNLETLGDDPLSFGSLSKLKQIDVNFCDKLLCVFPSQLVPMQRDLEKLTVELEGVEVSEPKTDILSPVYIKLRDLPKLHYISERDPMVFKHIHTLEIVQCHSLTYVFAPTMMKSIPQLCELKISLCKVLSTIVAGRNSLGESSVDEVEFPQLARLELKDLPNLLGFCRRVKKIHFPELKELSVTSVGSLSLFPLEVSLPNLEKLKLIGPQNLQALGESSVEEVEFPQLARLELKDMPNLLGFSSTVKKIHFPKLKELSVTRVGSLSLFPQEVSLPNLEKLELVGLRNLETLGHGRLSFGSLSNLKQIDVNYCDKLLCVFPSQLLPMQRDLEKLTVELEGVDTSEPNTDILSPSNIKLEFLCKLKYISERDLVVFRYIHTLEIFVCDTLRYVFAPIMAKSIPQLREMKISCCKVLSRIVAEKNRLGECLVDGVEFPQLARLKLNLLPNLVSFFPKVTTTPQPLFNGKVAIPSLKYLQLLHLKSLSDLWSRELPTSSFSELKELEVEGCANLRNVFHPSMVEALAKLEKLVIRNCLKMEAVVASEGKGHGTKIDKTMFSKLRKMELNNLPNLRRFCHFTCPLEFPLLRQMEIWSCPNMVAFSLGDSISFPKLYLPGTSSEDILNQLKEEQDSLRPKKELEGMRMGGQRESRGNVEEGAGDDESERTKRIKGKGVLET